MYVRSLFLFIFCQICDANVGRQFQIRILACSCSICCNLEWLELKVVKFSYLSRLASLACGNKGNGTDEPSNALQAFKSFSLTFVAYQNAAHHVFLVSSIALNDATGSNVQEQLCFDS